MGIYKKRKGGRERERERKVFVRFRKFSVNRRVSYEFERVLSIVLGGWDLLFFSVVVLWGFRSGGICRGGGGSLG